MFCCTVDDLDPNHDRIEYQDFPLKVRILEALGLKNFAINRFLFQRPVPTYSFTKTQDQTEVVSYGTIVIPPFGYRQSCDVLNSLNVSIPVVRLTPRHITAAKNVIIFSHGNGSDLSQALTFVSSLAEMHQAEYLAYDYTGYGLSQQKKTTPQSICDDLQMILAWLDRPLSEVILVGFSMGCYPTAKIASKYRVKAVVLLSPMISLIALLTDPSRLSVNTFFKNDQLSILQVIQNIQSHLLILHSKQDEIIPFRHSQLLYERYSKLSANSSVDLIEIEDLKHNELLAVLQTTLNNRLQKEFIGFLRKVEECKSAEYYILKRQKKEMEKRGRIGLELMHVMKKDKDRRRRSVERVSEGRLQRIKGSLNL